MPTSDDDLAAKADEVQRLREQVASHETNRAERERALANEVTMRQLEAEEASLRARLAVAKESAKAGSVKAGAAAPLGAVEDQLKAAVEQQKAAEKAPEASARATESTADGGAGGDTQAKSGGAKTAKES
jgi:hypothetical protein